MDELTEFHRTLIADVQGNADAMGQITAEAFLEKAGDILDEAGEVSSLSLCYYSGKAGFKSVQVDAYGWDPQDEARILTLVICDFTLSPEISTIVKTEIDRQLSRLVHFIEAALTPSFREKLEEASNAFSLCELIARVWKRVGKIKLILVTNKVNKAQSDALPIEPIHGVPVTMNVWDLTRLYKFIASGQTREELVIDFAEDFGSPVPLLKASEESAHFDSYIGVISGTQLAAIYDKWGARLLEANVRSFLQARGKVNSGIRRTILQEPAMFFSYNNGLTATAEDVEIADMGEGLLLMSARNFQIVNGGQTTASLHAARKAAEQQLKNIFVQMKLTVVPSSQAEEVVPLISEYANSQNKVSAADFFANHPFHIRMQEFSRRLLAPAGDAYRETRWFYERARGQYADERSRRTPAERKRFDADFPKNQLFSKTDLAKFENTWRCLPHIVSLGAQKNFGVFAQTIGKEWKQNDATFDENWYRKLIAKAIIFRNLERVVPAQPWYEGGYRANIVTYAIAKVVHDAAALGRLIDLDKVWTLQRVPVALERACLAAAETANHVITNPPLGVRNMSEWAKKQACWASLQSRKVDYEVSFGSILITPEAEDTRRRQEKREAALVSGIEAQREVVQQGIEYWTSLLTFGRSIRKLTPKEEGILRACTAIPSRIPSEKQCLAALEIADKLQQYY